MENCFLINSDINSCADKVHKGYSPRGWWTKLSNIDQSSIEVTDSKVKFSLSGGSFYAINDDSTNPFMGSYPVSTVTSNHGYRIWNEVVKFPLKALDPVNSQLIYALNYNEPLVFILEQIETGADGKYVVFGLFGGVRATEEMTYEMANDDRVWEVTMQGARVSYPTYFLFDTDAGTTEDLFNLLVNTEIITGLSLADGSITPQTVYLEVDADKTCKVILPDGTTLTSTAGVINDTWEGAAGNVTLIVPKETSLFDVSSSDFTGNMNFTVSAKTYIDLSNCEFTTAQCDFILDILIANGEVDGDYTIDFTDNLEAPTGSKITIVEGLGWTIPF